MKPGQTRVVVLLLVLLALELAIQPAVKGFLTNGWNALSQGLQGQTTNIPGSPFNNNIPNIKSPVSQDKPPGPGNNGQQIGNPACPPNWIWDPVNKKCFTPGGLSH